MKYYFLYTYLVTALAWALFAMKMNKYLFKAEAQPVRAFLINFVLCPIAIYVAFLDFNKDFK